MSAQDHYKTIFIKLDIACPPGLASHIESRISHARTLRNRIHLAVHCTVIVGAVVLFVPAIQYASSEASQSGFYQYLSLIISDSAYLAAHWRTALISILESAPVMGVALSIGTLLIFANSVQRGSRYVGVNPRLLAIKS